MPLDKNRSVFGIFVALVLFVFFFIASLFLMQNIFRATRLVSVAFEIFEVSKSLELQFEAFVEDPDGERLQWDTRLSRLRNLVEQTSEQLETDRLILAEQQVENLQILSDAVVSSDSPVGYTLGEEQLLLQLESIARFASDLEDRSELLIERSVTQLNRVSVSFLVGLSFLLLWIFIVSRREAHLTQELRIYKEALDEASDGILLLEKDFRIRYANARFYELFGQANEGPAFRFVELIAESSDKNAVRKMKKAVQNLRSFNSEKISCLNERNKVIPVEISLSSIAGLELSVMLIQDISLRKSVDRAKTEFVSLASHQLRTPLTSIRLFTELLGESDGLTKQQKEHLWYVQQSSARMARLINDLLNISRIETGRIIIEPEEADIVSIVRSVFVDMDTIAKMKDIELKLAPKSRKKILGVVDKDLLYNCILNLVSNAVKYSNGGNSVSVTVRQEKGGDIFIDVKDSGIGISKEEQGRVFKKFFRTAEAVNLDTDGTGLGLYLVKKIMDAAGGQVSFQSEAGKGSVFTLMLKKGSMKAKKGEKRISKSL